MAPNKPSVLRGDQYYETHHFIPHLMSTRGDSSPIHYGFELEAEFKDASAVGKALRDGSAHNEHGPWKQFTQEITTSVGADQLVYKTDGSLHGGGIEIISHPMSLNYLRQTELFEKLEKFSDRLVGFSSGRAGFHVHMTRQDFTPLHLYKFTMFHYRNLNLKTMIAQRPGGEYCQEPGSGVKVKNVVDLATGGRNGRGMINFQNRMTIEMRYFKSNLKAIRLYKNIEWLECVYYFTKNASISELTASDFFLYLAENKGLYPNLYAFVKERQAAADSEVSTACRDTEPDGEPKVIMSSPFKFFNRHKREDLLNVVMAPVVKVGSIS